MNINLLKGNIRCSIERLIFFSIAILIISCNRKPSDKIETIFINPTISNDQIKARIESILALETSDSCLIGRVTKVESYNDKFYIFDIAKSQTLFVFDNSGKFLHKTKKGRGPGEVIDPWDFDINREDNTILLWDQAPFNLKSYDLNLNFVKNLKCQSIAIRNFKYLGKGEYLILSQFPPVENYKVIGDTSYDYFVYTNNFQSVKAKIHLSNPLTLDLSNVNCIWRSDETYLIAPLDYAIYRFDNYKLTPIYYLDLGSYKINQEDLKKGYAFYRPIIAEGIRLGPFSDLFVSKKFISVSFSFKNHMEFFIYNRVKKEGLFSWDLVKNKQLPVCQLKGLSEDNTFLASVESMDLENFISKTNFIVNNNKPSAFLDNPFLIKFKLN